MPQDRACHMRQACALFRKTDRALDELARETGLVRRQRVVTAAAIVWAFVVTLGGQATEFISDVLRTLNAREALTLRYKPFWNRLAQRSFAAFMRELFQRLCAELSLRILERDAKGVAMQFSAILIDDGSSFAVADALRTVFPGRFTKIKPAAVELHAHMDLLSGSPLRVTLAPDKEAERQFLPPAKSLPRGSLSLRDRGYIDVSYFEGLAEAGAYLICAVHGPISTLRSSGLFEGCLLHPQGAGKASDCRSFATRCLAAIWSCSSRGRGLRVASSSCAW
jgi:hypothetical protein